MTWIAYGLGGFYIFGALMLVRAVRMDWFLERAIAQISLQPAKPDLNLLYIAACAVIYLGAGVALIALSVWSVWLLGAGLVLQAAYLPVAWRLADDAERADGSRWRASINAVIVSTASFAFACYAYRSQVLS